jgi:hypothetical protein
MANSSGIVRANAEPPGKAGPFTITPDARLEWPGGSVTLSLFIGSRRMGRSYAYSHQGHLYQAPIGYYANRQAWDWAPGYERDKKPDLARPITRECLFCHATRAVLPSEQVNHFSEIAHGIGCERCHGAVSAHYLIVAPQKLLPRLRDSVCEQCHLSGTVRLERAGRRMTDFQPGRDLSEYVEVFTGGVTTGVRVNSHSDALSASRCKQASGDRLWCGTCHNPHRASDYKAVCQSCHAKAHRTEDCTGCHMPKARATDGGHTVFTDHAIGRRREEPQPLRSYFGRAPAARDLGLAYFELATKNHDPNLIEKAWPLLRAAPQIDDPALLNALGGIMAADNRRDQAIAAYRVSLRLSPEQPDILLRLAALLEPAPEARSLRARAARLLPLP